MTRTRFELWTCQSCGAWKRYLICPDCTAALTSGASIADLSRLAKPVSAANRARINEWTAELIERQATELATAADELHELRTENMRLRHQARETAAIHDRLAAELVTAQASTDRLLNQCARQRALLDDVRNAIGGES